jgi:hypothetical protein
VKGLSGFRKLAPRQQIQVCIGVLLDGLDAPDILATDAADGQSLKRVAKDLSALAPDVRMPLVGTLLRRAFETIDQTGTK